MNVDLRGLLQLVHQVTGFLLRLPPDQLAGIADGRIPLAVGTEGAPEKRPAASGLVPGPRADPVPIPAPAPATGARTAAPAEPTAEHAEIAAMLRKQETVNDGLAYLAGVRLGRRKLGKSDLIAIGAELNLEIPPSYTIAKMHSRLADQAIGARKRFEGLRP